MVLLTKPGSDATVRLASLVVQFIPGWYLHLREVGGRGAEGDEVERRRGLGRGSCPLPRKFLDFLHENGGFLCILGAFRCLFYTHKFTSNCTFYMLFWFSWSRIKHSINCE